MATLTTPTTPPQTLKAEYALEPLIHAYSVSTLLGALGSYCAIQAQKAPTPKLQNIWSTKAMMIVDILTKFSKIDS